MSSEDKDRYERWRRTYEEAWSDLPGPIHSACPNCGQRKLRIWFFGIGRYQASGFLWCEACLSGYFVHNEEVPDGVEVVPVEGRRLRDLFPVELSRIRLVRDDGTSVPPPSSPPPGGEVADVLRAAATLIRSRGHTDPDTFFAVAGPTSPLRISDAIAIAAEDHGDRGVDAVIAVEDFVGQSLGLWERHRAGQDTTEKAARLLEVVADDITGNEG